MSTLET